MSGGSYEYLCFTEPDDLLRDHRQLRAMADRLAALGYAKDAAMETEELLAMVHQADVRILTRIRRLSPIWKAVEWWDSGDSGEDWLMAELRKYRGEAE